MNPNLKTAALSRSPILYTSVNNMKRGNSYYKKDTLPNHERAILMQSCPYNQLSILKARVFKAIKQHKIFIVSGGSVGDSLLRRLLVDRGWVEKIPANKINVSEVTSKTIDSDTNHNKHIERFVMSILVENAKPNFIWYCKDGYHDTAPHTLINRFRNETTWATKEGLCTSLENIKWHIDDEVYVNYPRTHISSNREGRVKFEEDYKITACTSLLKWILYMTAKGEQVCSSSGHIPHAVIRFALVRCTEYLLMRQNEDIDEVGHGFNSKTKNKWHFFLESYKALVTGQATFRPDTDNIVPIYLIYAEYFLEHIYKYRPQLSCDGYLNIWMIKPAQSSQGRGISMETDLSVLRESSNKGIFQKYIEEPLLIYETKFDIRQYYLVTNDIPLEIWMYKYCYLKFSSQRYNLNDFHESIHLTNHAVQKNYTNCDDRASELPQSNMWTMETFKEYLLQRNQGYVWEDVIYPGMRRAIIATMLCSQESMITYDDQKRFQIYGCDFVLDKDFNPWLIEINGKPDLNATTSVTADICPAVITDMVKVVFDRAADENAPTGQFECVFRQNIGPPHILVDDLTVYGHALPLSISRRPKQGEPVCKTTVKDVLLPLLQNLSNSSFSSISSSSSGSDIDSSEKKLQ